VIITARLAPSYVAQKWHSVDLDADRTLCGRTRAAGQTWTPAGDGPIGQPVTCIFCQWKNHERA
jgi:hypothetical protein